MDYLSSEKTPVDIKMAIINQLGWKPGNRHNSETFLNYLKKSRGYIDKADFRNRGKDFELLCYAYMKSMDNYFEVDEAIEYAGLANAKNKTSYTFSIFNALIKAQKKTGILSAWCEVYNLTNQIREDKSLTVDMNAKSIKLIFEYMEGYKDYCPGGFVNRQIVPDHHTCLGLISRLKKRRNFYINEIDFVNCWLSLH